MLYSTFETQTNAYIWNTGHRVELEKGVVLSDYTELRDEFSEETLQETYEWVCSRNKRLSMTLPTLMTIATGDSKSCQVWVDRVLLNKRSDLFDPKENFSFYYDNSNDEINSTFHRVTTAHGPNRIKVSEREEKQMSFPIGATIRLMRLQHKMTQQGLAEALYISPKTVSAYENGKNEPDLRTIDEIAKVFGMTMTSLIEKGESLMNVRKAKFYIDGLGDGIYPGFTEGDHWNGFACPFFEKETGMKIIDAWIAAGKEITPEVEYTASFDLETDSFYFDDDCGDGSIQFEGLDIVYEGKTVHVYPIGASFWVWDEFSEEEEVEK